MPSRPKRPRDPSQLAKLIVDISTGEVAEKNPNEGKNPAAVALSKLGASKGGHARAKKLSKKTRSQIAKHAAKRRWEKESETNAQRASAASSPQGLRPTKHRIETEEQEE